MHSSTVLLVVTLLLCAADVLCDVDASKEASSLCDARLDRLESHLIQLRMRLIDVETEKDVYRTELQSQKAELRRQKTALQTALTKLNSILGDRSQQPTPISPGNVMAQSDVGGLPVDVMTRAVDPLEAMVMQMGQRLTVTEADVQVLQNAHSQESQEVQAALTSTFTHWGASGCGNDSDVVYTGMVAGSHSNNQGAATNYVCLTDSPDRSLGAGATPNSNQASIWGGIYQTDGHHHGGLNPVCAVCQTRRPNTVMIPGSDVCTPGWRVQYNGYLMAGHWNELAGSEYICVDRKLEARAGWVNDGTHHGKSLYFSHARCGTLSCKDYPNLTIINCVVCSK